MPTTSPLSDATERPTRPRILTMLLALFATVALIAGACSNDEKSSEKDAEPDKAEDAGDTAATDDADSPKDDSDASGEDFTTTIEQAKAQLNEATEACDVFDAVGMVTDVSGPESSDDVRAATDYYVLLLTKMGETSSDPQVAETLDAGATQFRAYAESVSYDPEALDLNGEGPDYPGAAETEAAMDQWLNAELTGCMDPSLSIPAS